MNFYGTINNNGDFNMGNMGTLDGGLFSASAMDKLKSLNKSKTTAQDEPEAEINNLKQNTRRRRSSRNQRSNRNGLNRQSSVLTDEPQSTIIGG